MTYEITPAEGHLFVQNIKPKEKTEGGIIIPQSMQKIDNVATVVHSGHTNYQAGDLILYKEYAGSDVTLDGETYKVLQTDDIIAVLKEK